MNISYELNKNKKEFFISSILILLPIFFISGSLIINVSVVIVDLFFLYTLYINNDFKFLNNKYFYSLILFWIYLILNLFFSINFIESLPRSFGLIRFIIFAFAINYFFFKKTEKVKSTILNAWTCIFLFITLDLLVEFIFGSNMFGFISPYEGRLGSVLGEELKIGHFYFSLVLIVLYNLQKIFKIKFNNDYIFYSTLILFLMVSLFIGERSNFIKTLFIIFLFVFIFDKKNLLNKILSICLIVLSFSILINLNDNYKSRFWGKGFTLLFDKPIESILSSKYGSHYKVAIQVFNNNKLFGVGLKNYRLEVIKKKYNGDPSIHPHQTHFEILSELGLIGYIFFISTFFFILFHSIKSYNDERDNLKLCGILFVIASLIPLIPSGSFFTTFGAVLFWFNFCFLLPVQKD